VKDSSCPLWRHSVRSIGPEFVFVEAPHRYYYRTAKVGQTVKFPCHTKLKEEVDWARLDTRDSQPKDIYLGNLGIEYNVWSDRQFTVMDRNHSYALVIHNVTVNDSAYYRCVEDNGFGNKHFYGLTVQLAGDFLFYLCAYMVPHFHGTSKLTVFPFLMFALAILHCL